jgi:hypothetical protein
VSEKDALVHIDCSDMFRKFTSGILMKKSDMCLDSSIVLVTIFS